MSTMTAEAAENVIEELAERRLDWDRIKGRIDTALARSRPEELPDHGLGPFVTVSGQAGTDGRSLARGIGTALGWPALDGEIVDLVADVFHLDGAMLHLLDEAKANWVREVLGELMPHEVVNRDAYVHHLGKVLRLVALHGNVVLVGRGAQLFLPRRQGLAIRLVAPVDERVRRVSERDGIGVEEARRRVEDVDRRRSDFLRHYFDRDIDDPLLYDLVLNVDQLSEDDVVEVAVTACRRLGFDR